jgi:small GTP-binding protein
MDDIPTLKILTLGDASVGKTCILLRFSEDQFPTVTMPTIGIEYKTKTVTIKKRQINLQVWDTAGQERYHRTLATTFYQRVHGIALVFDLTEKASFDHVEGWFQQIQSKADSKVAVVLVGNKSDIVENLDLSNAQSFAAKHSLPFFTVSAKTGDNIELVFSTLAEIIIEKDSSALATRNDLKLRTNPSVPKSKCC